MNFQHRMSQPHLSLSCVCQVLPLFHKFYKIKNSTKKTTFISIKLRYFHCLRHSLYHGTKIVLKILFLIFDDVIRLEFEEFLPEVYSFLREYFFTTFANFGWFHKIKYTQNFLLNGIFKNRYTLSVQKINTQRKYAQKMLVNSAFF